jgi:hypothetical protein
VSPQSSSRLRSIAELPNDIAKASSGRLWSSSSFRLRACFCGARLACEADLEHKAKATADRLSSFGSVLDAPWTGLRLRKVVRAEPKRTCRYLGQVGRRRGVTHYMLAEAEGALRTFLGHSGTSPYQRWVGQNNFQ